MSSILRHRLLLHFVSWCVAWCAAPALGWGSCGDYLHQAEHLGPHALAADRSAETPQTPPGPGACHGPHCRATPLAPPAAPTDPATVRVRPAERGLPLHPIRPAAALARLLTAADEHVRPVRGAPSPVEHVPRALLPV